MRCAGLVLLGAALLTAPFARAQTTDAEPAFAPAAAPPSAPAAGEAGSNAASPSPDPSASVSPKRPNELEAGDGVERFVVVDDSEPDLPFIPDAKDSLAGHFSLAVGGGVAFPFGNVQSKVTTSDVIAPGWALSLNAGIGVSRSVAVGVFGQYLFYGDGDECTGCDGTSFAVGPFIRYHLVQGVRFDPWVLAGIGYRTLSVSTAEGDLDYSGIEWLHLEFGGDWYATSTLGFGPYLGFDWGIFGNHPGDGDSSSHFQLTTGLRIDLDLPGK